MRVPRNVLAILPTRRTTLLRRGAGLAAVALILAFSFSLLTEPEEGARIETVDRERLPDVALFSLPVGESEQLPSPEPERGPDATVLETVAGPTAGSETTTSADADPASTQPISTPQTTAADRSRTTGRSTSLRTRRPLAPGTSSPPAGSATTTARTPTASGQSSTAAPTPTGRTPTSLVTSTRLGGTNVGSSGPGGESTTTTASTTASTKRPPPTTLPSTTTSTTEPLGPVGSSLASLAEAIDVSRAVGIEGSPGVRGANLVAFGEDGVERLALGDGNLWAWADHEFVYVTNSIGGGVTEERLFSRQGDLLCQLEVEEPVMGANRAPQGGYELIVDDGSGTDMVAVDCASGERRRVPPVFIVNEEGLYQDEDRVAGRVFQKVWDGEGWPWDITNEDGVVISGEYPLNYYGYSPTGAEIAYADFDDRSVPPNFTFTVSVRDTSTGELRWSRAFSDPVNFIAHTGRYIAVGVIDDPEGYLHGENYGSSRVVILSSVDGELLDSVAAGYVLVDVN